MIGKQEELRRKSNSRFNIGDIVQFTDKLLGIKVGMITKVRDDDYHIKVHVRDGLHRSWSIKKDDITLRQAGEP